jgi:hypothetical protein
LKKARISVAKMDYGRLRIAAILSGSAAMPSFETTNPRKIPELTNMTILCTFTIMPYSTRRLKTIFNRLWNYFIELFQIVMSSNNPAQNSMSPIISSIIA